MPIFLAALIGGLVSASGSIVGRVLLSIGMGFVCYTGFSILFDWIRDTVFDKLLGLDPFLMQVLSLLEIDAAISILFSAFIVRLLMSGLTGGAITKSFWKC